MWRRFSRLRNLARARWDAVLAAPGGEEHVARGAAAGAFAAMIPAFGLHLALALGTALLARGSLAAAAASLPPHRQPARPCRRVAARLRAWTMADPRRLFGTGVAAGLDAHPLAGGRRGAGRWRPARRDGGPSRILRRAAGARRPRRTARQRFERPALRSFERRRRSGVRRGPAPGRRRSSSTRKGLRLRGGLHAGQGVRARALAGERRQWRRLFVRCFGGNGTVRENAAGDVLASLTTMVWNAPSKSWTGGAPWPTPRSTAA